MPPGVRIVSPASSPRPISDIAPVGGVQHGSAGVGVFREYVVWLWTITERRGAASVAQDAMFVDDEGRGTVA